ncbi:MAG: crossover junction endodeoxyribonuclease RuvC [Candidatus Omnitrophica bacterium]|nr:crossover junction endodeoxyribonuclease RuvC [Candidatus Omnitrophota bacterium]
MVILGIDPGLNRTGYGIIDAGTSRLQFIAAGDIRPMRQRPLPERLATIHDQLCVVIARFHPDTAVLEQIFTHHAYVNTATLMGHARGAACLAVQEHELPMAEYPPAQVKKSVAGHGAASKEQVARMVAQWLQTSDPSWSADATDALALAIVHAHLSTQQGRLSMGIAS